MIYRQKNPIEKIEKISIKIGEPEFYSIKEVSNMLLHKKHYMGLVTPKEALVYWNIYRKTKTSVIDASDILKRRYCLKI